MHSFVRKEVQFRPQVLPQPWHQLEDVDVEISSVLLIAWLLVYVHRAPAHHPHLQDSRGKHSWDHCFATRLQSGVMLHEQNTGDLGCYMSRTGLRLDRSFFFP